jgi:phosphoribosyl 1,2-cyclic phosphate phosphodiesterase
MRVTILGCGTSSGVPRVGNDWGSCDPSDPRNRRRRVSILVEEEGTAVLIDTSPDMREQLLDAGVSRLDAVLYTHDHADHCHGVDDLRQVFHAMGRRVECYADERTWDVLARRFDYVFEGTDGYPAVADANLLPERLDVGPLSISSFDQIHGRNLTRGYRIEGPGATIAYSTDLNEIPEASEAALEDLDLWIVDALRVTPHPSHAHLDLTLEWIARFRPGRAVLTHMDNSMDYARLVRSLPGGVEPAYDMLAIDL